MCAPLVAAAPALSTLGTALSIASTVAGVVGQMQNAKAQASYQRAQAEATNAQIAANNALALRSYDEQTRATQERQRQVDAAATNDIQDSAIRKAQAQATARVAAAEAGVAGLSVDALLADFERTDARYRDVVMQNREGSRRQGQLEIEGFRTQAEGRAQSIRPFVPSPIQQPDYFGAALRIGTDIYDSARSKRPKVN